MEDKFSTDWQGAGQGDGSGDNASDGEPWAAADEASLARPPLTSCCTARFLTGCGPVPVHGLGVGDPDIEHREFGLLTLVHHTGNILLIRSYEPEITFSEEVGNKPTADISQSVSNLETKQHQLLEQNHISYFCLFVCFVLFFWFFWLHLEACGILVP